MKVLYDTCLYIDFLRSGKHESLFTERTHIRYLSPMVLLELHAGARTKRQQKVVEKLFRPYLKADRVITLRAEHYEAAGRCLASLAKRNTGLGLSHDVLIALSAKSIGATLFTHNKRDFSRIARYVDFYLEIV